MASCGEFLQGVIIENASGITTNPYKNGDSTALYELESLLLTGTSNSRRLLCEVTQNRYLRIYEEPIEPDVKDKDHEGENAAENDRHFDVAHIFSISAFSDFIRVQ